MKFRSLFWRGLAIAAVGCFAAFCATASMADPLQIQCTTPTVCVAGGIQTTTSSTIDFNLAMSNGKYPGGTAYLVFLEPVANSPLAIGTSEGVWTGSPKTAGDFVGFTNSQHNYSSSQSFSLSAGGYNVYLDSLGSFTGATSFSISSLPSGTLVIGYVVTPSGGILTTPWSESLDVTSSTFPTPEPGTLLLLGSGLLGLGFSLRRRFVA